MSENGLADAEIGICIPTYNKFAYARRACLSFLKHTSRPIRLYVIDDASSYYDRQDWKAWRAPAKKADGTKDGLGIPDNRLVFKHFGENAGLTRSWNLACQWAREQSLKYLVLTNSDVIATRGWEEPLIYHLEHGYHLVGPVTNAPGPTNRGQQQVANYYPGYRVTDDPEYLRGVADYLRQHYPPNIIRPVNINGFFMMSRTEHFWAGAYDNQHVFNPKKKMTGNEDELQGRWHKKGYRTGFVPSSFVFHYRSVSRGDRYKHQGWLRIDDINKPI